MLGKLSTIGAVAATRARGNFGLRKKARGMGLF
jgi:hypothetical protein